MDEQTDMFSYTPWKVKKYEIIYFVAWHTDRLSDGLSKLYIVCSMIKWIYKNNYSNLLLTAAEKNTCIF